MECFTDGNPNEQGYDLTSSGCSDLIDNIGSEAMPVFTVKLAIHFINIGNGNFYDGTVSDWNHLNGTTQAISLINQCNEILSNFHDNPIQDIDFTGDSRIRFEIVPDYENGVYFWDNISDYTPVPGVLNVKFIDKYDPTKQGNDRFFIQGIACGIDNDCDNVRIWGWQSSELNDGPWHFWSYAKLLNHEIFHILGLNHSWYSWAECSNVDIDYTKEWNGGDRWGSGSENTMNYVNCQCALSPCQWSHIYSNCYDDHFSFTEVDCSQPPTNIVVDHDQIWEKRVIVIGDVIIKEGVTLTIKCKVELNLNSEIDVGRGAKLIVDGGTLTSLKKCNVDQWEGIIVEGNSNLPQPNYYDMPAHDEAGIVITRNGATIENAHIGISTNYSGQWSDQYWGGVVHCEDTDFKGCWKGIEFMRYDLLNNSYIGRCTFSGWKAGITIWATDGIEIENCSFDDQYLGVGFLDSKVFVQHGNSFTGCTRGILAMESVPGDSRLVVEDDNQFINNDTAIVLSGQNNSDIRDDNYFESNDVGVKISGYNQVDITDNFFMANNDNITSDVTGNNYNKFSCNIMTGQNKGIWYLNENLKSEFLSNDFIGTYDADVFGLYATVNGEIGSSYDGPALNLFSDIDHDLYWPDYLGNSEFIYYLPNSQIPRTDPKYDGNFEKQHSSKQGLSCNDLPTPVITTVILQKAIDDYCYWYYKYKENPQNKYFKKKFLKYEKKLHSYYYYWKYDEVNKKSWKEIEEILKTICGHRWKVTLFGHYLSVGRFSEAKNMLNVINSLKGRGNIIPEDMTDEQISSFVEIQRINLKLHEKRGYRISGVEKETLRSDAMKNIPESAYAIGTYYLATGELLSRPLPDYEDKLEERAKNFEKPKWLIYPNPVSNKLNVLYSGDKKSSGSIVLYDMLGNKVRTTEYQLKRGHKKQMDVSKLSQGIYLLDILDKNDEIIKIEKIVIGSNK